MFQIRTLAHLGLAASILSLSLAPLPALAQNTDRVLKLTPTGAVQKWNPQSKKWEEFHGGIAHQGETYRAIEGGSLDCRFENQPGKNPEHFRMDSCSAIRFVTLNVPPTPNGTNTLYCKFFGQFEMWMPDDRQVVDDIKFEMPVGLEIFGKTVPGAGPTTHTVCQTPTARWVRAGTKEGENKLQGVSFIEGTVVSVDPNAGTFVVKDQNGQMTTVTVKGWTQLARRSLNARVMDETPAQIVQALKVGEAVIVYGVATAALTGSSAFEPSTPPINFYTDVIFPPGGQYIFGGTFVLASPITPTVGTGTVGGPDSTLIQEAGKILADLQPGIHLVNTACEIGNEVFVVPPPLPPAVLAGGAVGSLPVYILVGAGIAGGLLIHGGTSNRTPPISLP